MGDSRYNSPARSVGEPCSLTSADSETDEILELYTENPSNPDCTIVDGYLKFRDCKRWKQRWGVVTKLSPAAAPPTTTTTCLQITAPKLNQTQRAL
ncbi:hypothetical protein LSTR_LSTR009452 [Laodelphax striatellus]|uniref:Uncharacterized protein n=1 Tax=Laodelphax striatellus TaxID=195883 RepID=A0A482X4E2_LAOST|nr:hypothetical protein LSTR_LSTR009452 [Laodelphax striatellus]